MQGGPGCSSLFGLFYLNGPFQLQVDMTLRDNPGKWSRQYGMLFLDQPIGTGFSIAGARQMQTGRWQLPQSWSLVPGMRCLYPAGSSDMVYFE